MGFFTRFITFITLGSTTPTRRLLAYYAVLGVIGFALFTFVPSLSGLLTGERLEQVAQTPAFLQDGMTSGAIQDAAEDAPTILTFTVSTAFIFFSTLALILPVTWVYMSARPGSGHNQSLVQALIVLPMIVAGIVLMVRNSLALAFSLAGVVAAVRFRTNLSDARDVVFIFVAIAVGFAAGVQVLLIAVLLTILFNFVLIALWRYDFGRSVLEPTAASQWAAPLADIAGKDAGGAVVPDRDLVLALTPKKAAVLADRFARVQDLLGSNGKKPRFDAILSVTAQSLSDAQRHIEPILNRVTKRWRLDDVVNNTDKPSELYYLIRTRASVTSDEILTQLRSNADGAVSDVTVEIGRALAIEAGEERQERKMAEKSA